MCGRITQYRDRDEYAKTIGWPTRPLHPAQGSWGATHLPHFNLPPGLHPDVMHTLHEGKPMFDTVHWGYQPPWAKEKQLPATINARLETAATKPYFRHMFGAGRVIVPADGWYEWTGEKGHKQPWYIRLRTNEPMFMAAITNYRPYTKQEKQVGFVIVTEASDQGMVDIHDRRPVVLAPEDARIWMDNTIPAEQADQLVRSCSLPPEVFDWYRVSTDVNNARNNEARLINPI